MGVAEGWHAGWLAGWLAGPSDLGAVICPDLSAAVPLSNPESAFPPCASQGGTYPILREMVYLAFKIINIAF